ncbi:MAG: restriction endonuclease subunit S domain-containing protein, partial [Metallibacterium sp.]
GPIKHLEATIVGTTVAHLSARDLKEMRLLVPPHRVLNSAALVLDPLFDLELLLKKKNHNLRTTRDLLLPKLISGELDVSDLPEPQAVAA